MGSFCTMPLYAMYRVEQHSEESLLRATVLSYLDYNVYEGILGKLSAADVQLQPEREWPAL